MAVEDFYDVTCINEIRSKIEENCYWVSSWFNLSYCNDCKFL